MIVETIHRTVGTLGYNDTRTISKPDMTTIDIYPLELTISLAETVGPAIGCNKNHVSVLFPHRCRT